MKGTDPILPAEVENNNTWWLMDLWWVLGARQNIMQSVWERSAYWSASMAPLLHIKNISAHPNTSLAPHPTPSPTHSHKKNDLKCTALYSSPSPDSFSACQDVFQTQTQTHSSLLKHSWPLKKFSDCFWQTYQYVCSDRKGKEGVNRVVWSGVFKRRHISLSSMIQQSSWVAEEGSHRVFICRCASLLWAVHESGMRCSKRSSLLLPNYKKASYRPL